MSGSNQAFLELVDGRLNVIKLESWQKLSFPVEPCVDLDPHIVFRNQSALLL